MDNKNPPKGGFLFYYAAGAAWGVGL